MFKFIIFLLLLLSFNSFWILIQCSPTGLTNDQANFDGLSSAIRFASNMAKGFALLMKKERNLTDHAHSTHIETPDWLPIVIWNLHQTVTSKEELLIVSQRYFTKIENTLDQFEILYLELLLINPNAKIDHLADLKNMRVANTNILLKIKDISNEHDYNINHANVVLPPITNSTELDQLALCMMENYKNATNYLDKLIKFLNSNQMLLDEHCQSKYFHYDNNIQEYHLNLSIAITFMKHLMKNMTRHLIINTNTDLANLVNWMQLEEIHMANSIEDVLKVTNTYIQKISTTVDQLLCDQRLCDSRRQDIESIDVLVKVTASLMSETMCRQFGWRHKFTDQDMPNFHLDMLADSQLDHFCCMFLDQLERGTILLDTVLEYYIYDQPLFDFTLTK